MEAANMKTVYTIVDRGAGKSYWVKVGVGFVNKDTSLNLKLDAIPVNGTLQVRDWEPKEAAALPPRNEKALEGPRARTAA